MELSKYIGKLVKVDLINGYFYEGLVLPDTKDDTLELKDRNNNLVTLKSQAILYIREIENG